VVIEQVAPDLFTSYGKYVEDWRAENEQQEND
jgi:hypothetical protein